MTFKDYIGNSSKYVGDYWEELKYGIYLIFIFLDINIDIVKILSYLMLADTALGVIKTIIIKHLKFSFKELYWGVITKATILLIPMLVALTAKGLHYDFRWLVNIVLKVLILSESISSLTNILSIKERKIIENTDFVSKLLRLLRLFFKNIIDNFFKTLKK
ncbi:MAG: hypothetical protein KGY51_11535 [Psychroflexus sp.]|nr:hypothetical protein [Psychroflexus sp.]